jgi:hypothetical protein
MEQVVPWAAFLELIAPYYPEGKTGRPPSSLANMLRVNYTPQCFTLSDSSTSGNVSDLVEGSSLLHVSRKGNIRLCVLQGI